LEAEQSYDRAGFLVDSMLGRVSSVAAKTSLIETMTDLYVGEFALLSDDLHLPEKAFLTLESARGRILRDLLLRGESTDSSQEAKLEHQISELRLRLAATSSPIRAERLRDQIFLAEQARWLTQSGKKWPAQEIHPLSMAEIRRHIEPDELILEYVLGDSRSYCLTLTNQALRIVPLPERAVIERDVEAYSQAIRNHAPGSAEAKGLYEDLLGSVPQVSSHPKLIVVPDGKLFLVPFDALMKANGEYVVATHNVSYAPYANTLVLMRSRQTEKRAAGSLLAVGGVPYDQQQRVTKTVLRAAIDGALSNLPGSKEEVAIASSVDQSDRKTMLVGAAATETAVKHADLEHRSVIHLAVHGIADIAHPDRAALILLNDPATAEDGLLEAPEISNMHRNADLVVLSACDTAAGKLQGEAGVANLSGAFLLGGARAVISTLWSVDDTFSVFLMKQFYSHLMNGETIEAALSNSKRDVLQTYGTKAVPYLWAGYVVEGVADHRVKTNEHNVYASN
jgi:CHAT domain-containing protein